MKVFWWSFVLGLALVVTRRLRTAGTAYASTFLAIVYHSPSKTAVAAEYAPATQLWRWKKVNSSTVLDSGAAEEEWQSLSQVKWLTESSMTVCLGAEMAWAVREEMRKANPKSGLEAGLRQRPRHKPVAV